MATEKEKRIPASILRDKFYYTDDGCLRWFGAKRKKGFKSSMCDGMPAFQSKEKKGYLSGRLCGVFIKGHRAIWAWHHGDWPEDQIDHINGIPWDNRIENLRVVSNKENCKNKSKPKGNTSGWIGVSFHKLIGKWSAKYCKNYKDYHVGYFNCPTAAGLAVMRARNARGFSDGHGRDSALS